MPCLLTARWFVGLVYTSGFAGALVTYLAVKLAHRQVSRDLERAKFQETEEPRIPWIPFLIGVAERIAFTIIVAHAEATGVLTLMGGWIAIKLAVGWQRGASATTAARARAFVGVLGSLLSFGFAFAGGLIWAGRMWPIHPCP